jgi:hypothetical protein
MRRVVAVVACLVALLAIAADAHIGRGVADASETTSSQIGEDPLLAGVPKDPLHVPASSRRAAEIAGEHPGPAPHLKTPHQPPERC